MTIVKDAGLARASMPLELKAGGSEGTFEGYGAIFGNVDRDGDTVARGAFAESLKARLPMLLWQHDTKSPIGRFDEVREDERGLYVRGRLSMSGRGAEAYELLRMGALDGLSIGFVTREATRDAATGTRTILKADLMEISLVTFPANELARITSVKSAHGGIPDDPRAFEHFLRENGFSRTRARTITAKGFGGEPSAHEIAALVAEVKRRTARVSGGGELSGTLSDILRKLASHAGEQLWGELADVGKAEIGRMLVEEVAKRARAQASGEKISATFAPGGREQFILPALWDGPFAMETERGPNKTLVTKVESLQPGTPDDAVKFVGRIGYLSWRNNGHLWRSGHFSHKAPYAKLQPGGSGEINTWAENLTINSLLTTYRQLQNVRRAAIVTIEADRSNTGPARISVAIA